MKRFFSKVIYRPSNFSTGAPFGLRSVGHARFAPGENTTSRAIDFVQLLWTVKGEGFIRQYGKDYVIRKNYVAFYTPGMEHLLYTNKKIWEYRWFTIDGVYASILIKGFSFDTRPFKAGKCPENMFIGLEKHIKRIGPKGEKLATVQVYKLLANIATGLKPVKSKNQDEALINKALEIIHNNIHDSMIGINQISAMLEIDRSTLTHRFKSFIGISPKEYVNSLRIQRVLHLLRTSRLSVSEISYKTGFSNPNYMTKFFHKKMGMPPSHFREICAKSNIVSC